MCELFGLNGTIELNLTPCLKEFFSHSTEHPDGWGIFNIDKDEIIKEPLPAYESSLVKTLISSPYKTLNMFAHIRQATKGSMIYENAHPFRKTDASGRVWTFMHNGTVFDFPRLDVYKESQLGATDSERILWYLTETVNDVPDEELPKVLADTIRDMTPNNKLNLMFYDGSNTYVHTNMKSTLYYATVKRNDNTATLFSTAPLKALHEIDDIVVTESWTPLPLSKLMVYKDGQRIFEANKKGAIYTE